MGTRTGTESGSDTAAGLVLSRVRGHRRDADAAEAALLADVLAWAELHVTTDPEDAATWGGIPVRLGGQGCPFVREHTVTELAAALGLSPASGRQLVEDVLELAFRLPRLWARVQAGRVQAWRARRIAQDTIGLTLEAAGFVDAQFAAFASRVGPAQVERLVEAAIARFMPDLARERRQAAADGRHFDVHHDQVSFAGTSRVEGELDLADAIAHTAQGLKDLGSDLPPDQRRALAAGELARTQLALALETTAESADPDTRRASRRDLTLYAHLSTDAATNHIGRGDGAGCGGPGSAAGINPDTTVTVEGHGHQLITLGTLRDWLTTAGDTKVTIRPVIDLKEPSASTGYRPSPRLREQVILRDKTCVFPWCNRPARHLDLDHIDPWHDLRNQHDHEHDGGPPGETTSPAQSSGNQTTSGNLAALCRHHHRAKTLTGWRYAMIEPGTYLWTSPHGLQFLTDPRGTTDLS